jgi:hypothetical protein
MEGNVNLCFYNTETASLPCFLLILCDTFSMTQVQSIEEKHDMRIEAGTVPKP